MSGNKSGRITGLGGVFVKCKNRDDLVKWYRDDLGLSYDGYGINFLFREHHEPDREGYNVWGPFKEDTDYFKPSDKDFMLNLRVENLEGFLKTLKEKGIEQIGEMVVEEYGKFAWIVDPEGTKIELWEQIGPVPEIPTET
ncbi:VOC family protein [Kordiimonas sp. SCSIO 12610]|uniref:VOC family protein n=1 Tax=Kordiimonas sp. SCSIO 12610 TaxID=2829597 RepID=UPI00210E5325|nr:VOC family protein [Kordiimonas sp. SCSIO 12610]UTW56809.1 VOC family protein [Kordiimonas sp. SCSIO 12610]